MDISIHALVKRATHRAKYMWHASLISIHALVKRATAMARSFFYDIKISIHALVKRATTSDKLPCGVSDISIHALVKRATSDVVSAVLSDCHFNPRPREEGDDSISLTMFSSCQFQSTPS